MLTNDSASALAALGPVTECHGVQLRAQLRSVATLVQVTGQLSDANRDLVSSQLRRFALAGGALVLDLIGASGVDDDFLRTLGSIADLTLVLDPSRHHGLSPDAAAIASSWGDAMRGIVAHRTILARTVSQH
ncbi:hypothetical protein CIW49_13795 [Mycolicibacterium sp. P1-18]|uniref:hypothetical protein n=1 Tax=Mycolicibacterium sp. P1-18 TaxID=2024615 RepID=UPI0011F1AAB7|nr:hypothetical protein [Mycolicibacterium sp. P1-18]KAA0098941.1 hypothetical protein CIW49_13795 [Mycolicibacterium sp. P1-18]